MGLAKPVLRGRAARHQSLSRMQQLPHMTSHTTDITAPLARLKHWFETLTPASVAEVSQLYARHAHFKDPFNEVRGHEAIAAIFSHMFTQVHAPRFVLHETVAQGGQAFISWVMFYRRSADARDERQIRGCSHLRFDAQGRVLLHRDYWDAAEELYEGVPVLGALMRWLKRRLAVAL